MLNGHGDDAYRYQNKIIGNFSSNVNPYGTPEGLISFLKEEITNINTYPEVACESLSLLYEEKNNLPQGTTIFTNGATEAFYMIAKMFQGKYSLIGTPTFSEYEDASRACNHRLTFFPVAGASQIDIDSDLIWLCNPNNPDGGVTSRETILELVETNPQTVFVIDEAYVDFCKGDISVMKEAVNYSNLIVVRSLTKKYTIPGLRLGYLVANHEMIKKLLKFKQPWSVNSLAASAGKYLIENPPPKFELDKILEEKEYLFQELNKVEGVYTVPSDTTFFLLEIEKVDPAGLKDYLAKEHGLLIRDASNFRGLFEVYIRIAVQERHLNQKLVEGIKSWIAL